MAASNPAHTLNAEEVLDELAEYRRTHGKVERWRMRFAADLLGCSEGHLRRLVGARQPAVAAHEPITITEEVIAAIARHSNLADYVWRTYGEPKGSAFYQRLRRALIDQMDPQERVVALGAGGMRAWRNVTIYSRFCASHVNEAWHMDIQQLNTHCIPERSDDRVSPYLICAIDSYSRKVVLWEVIAHPRTKDGKARAVNGPDIATALLNAMVRNGIPKVIYIDNGKETTSEVATRVAAACDTTFRAVERFRGEGKPYVEAAFRTLESRILSGDPARTDGPASSARFGLIGGDIERARTVHELRADVAAVIDRHNNNPHSALKDPAKRTHRLSPDEKWKTDTTERMYPDRTQIRRAAAHTNCVNVYGRTDDRILSRMGVELGGEHYTTLGLSEGDLRAHSRKLTGRKKEVSGRGFDYDPSDPSLPDRVAVYDHNNKFLFFAQRHEDVDEEQAIHSRAAQERSRRNGEQHVIAAQRLNEAAADERSKSRT